MLALRVSGHIGGRFPCHLQVTRRGETQAGHAAERNEGGGEHGHQRGLQLVEIFTHTLNQRLIITEGNRSSQIAAEEARICGSM